MKERTVHIAAPLIEKHGNMQRDAEIQAVYVLICPYHVFMATLKNICAVRREQKKTNKQQQTNKQINQIMGGQGHLARRDQLWIWVLVTNRVDPLIGSETATK